MGVPNDLAVDGARNAVLQLQVHLGHRVLSEDGGVRDITCRISSQRLVLVFTSQNLIACLQPSSSMVLPGRRTDSGRLDHVPDRESLDCLVLGRASRAVGATDRLDVTASLLVTSAAEKWLASDRVRMLVHFRSGGVSYLDARFLTIFAFLRSAQQVLSTC